jgi:large conductance mechanosensitive channel
MIKDPLVTLSGLEPAKRAFTLWGEFRNFAFKGNVIDLAVGVIIGAAFSKIVNSLVENLIMPLISVIVPADTGYADWVWTVAGKPVPYGKFLADVLNFLLVALVLFIFIVKFLGWVMRVRKEEVAIAPPLTKEQALLTEIRDLLRDGQPREARGAGP